MSDHKRLRRETAFADRHGESWTEAEVDSLLAPTELTDHQLVSPGGPLEGRSIDSLVAKRAAEERRKALLSVDETDDPCSTDGCDNNAAVGSLFGKCKSCVPRDAWRR